ncbi:MAG: DUF5343 domain-containing protein [Silvibacterium sp.]
MAESETRKSYPMLPTSHWWALRKKFRQSLPGIVTDSYLATVLNMGIKSARANVLPFLKTLGIIDSEGRPTQRATLWRDDEHYAEVCKAILEEVYPSELRDAVTAPVEPAKARRWFAHQTHVGEAAANRMVAMYSVLVESDPTKQPDVDKKAVQKKAAAPVKKASNLHPSAKKFKASLAADSAKISDQGEISEGNSGDQLQRRRSLDRGPEVNINLQIHISADASADQIDQIFASMSKHLYKHG